jgi:hypothetical protein
MPSADEIRGHLTRIIGILQDARIPHMVTGALVRNALAPARTSEDLDVVLDMRGRTPDDVRALFEANGYRVEGPLKGDLGTRLVLDLPQYEADIWLAPDTDIHRGEMARAKEIDYHGLRLRIMDPEDYVLRKLVNTRRRRNPNDLDDAYQVLLHAWADIDAERLIARATGHRVETTARELVDLVREDRAALEAGRSPEG